MIRAAIDRARLSLLARAPEEFEPADLRFLLHECTRLTDASLRHAVEQGLTRALSAAHTDPDPWRRIGWVRLLADAVAFSDDERLAGEARRALPAAVEWLEHRVRQRYEPGEGLVGATCLEELLASGALLDAWGLTARLPYGMLAEELLRHARQRWWDETSATFDAGHLPATCAGLTAATRLAALHTDPDYLRAAIVGNGVDLRADARRMTTALLASLERQPDAFSYAGAALSEWFALESDLQ